MDWQWRDNIEIGNLDIPGLHLILNSHSSTMEILLFSFISSE